MPRPPSAPSLLIDTLQKYVEPALNRLPPGSGPGQRDDRSTRVRLACDVVTSHGVTRPTVPLIRALIGSGSPNDIGADIRTWLTTAAERRTLVTIRDPLLKDLAGTLESTLVQLIERARQTAEQALEPERKQLDVERREFEKQRLAIEVLQRQAKERDSLLGTLRDQLALERALRSAAEEERTAIHAQRDGLVQRLTLAEERLTALPGLKKENAKLQSELARRATEIERLRARVDALGELRVKQELAERDVSHQRERARELERQLAQVMRKLESTNQKLAIRKQSAMKKAKGRARVAAKRARP